MGFFDRLKAGLAKTKEAIFKQVDDLFKKFVRVDEEMLEELEELLTMADVGVTSSVEIIDRLREEIQDRRISDPAEASGRSAAYCAT